MVSTYSRYILVVLRVALKSDMIIIYGSTMKTGRW